MLFCAPGGVLFGALHRNLFENELASARIILSDEYLEVRTEIFFLPFTRFSVRPVARFSVRRVAICLQYGHAGARVISRNDQLEVHAKINFHHLHAFRCTRWRVSQCSASQSTFNMCMSVLGPSRGTSIMNYVLKKLPFACFLERPVVHFSMCCIAIRLQYEIVCARLISSDE